MPRRFPAPWSARRGGLGKIIKTRAPEILTTRSPRDDGDQSTEYCNFLNGHRVIPLTDGLRGVLHVNLSAGKSYSDGGNNDDEGHKPQISRSDLFFALRASPRLQV